MKLHTFQVKVSYLTCQLLHRQQRLFR